VYEDEHGRARYREHGKHQRHARRERCGRYQHRSEKQECERIFQSARESEQHRKLGDVDRQKPCGAFGRQPLVAAKAQTQE